MIAIVDPSFTILKLCMLTVVDAAVNHHLFLCNLLAETQHV